jgi:hypothetical protein
MIGEMWDLERLCEKAEELGRWTCFVSSVPLKVSGILWDEIDLDADCSIGPGWCCESAERRCNILNHLYHIQVWIGPNNVPTELAIGPSVHPRVLCVYLIQ